MTTVWANINNRRGRQVFACGNPWVGPSIGLGLAITESVPPVVSGASTWLTFDRPGMEGRDCVDPGPNNAYNVSGGVLNIKALAPGWPMITRQTFRKDRYCSVQWVAAAKALPPYTDGFHSAGLYDGELDYRTLNLVPGSIPGMLDLVVLAEPAHLWTVLVPNFCAADGFHLFRIDHDGFGMWSYFVDEVLYRVDVSGPLKNDPHVCIFTGGMTAKIGSITVNIED